ncbi:Bug family tripartite tricarboxylate transporter substrate binding protein [Roseomonas chloroacetimidivorans]|uniref:Bug family tripartite tricarboxylate transporter substrate binding protein n=1 Tax=Roseomonas chloroacetimidivorans TaxID=1766656 RepID=UPI003C77100B
MLRRTLIAGVAASSLPLAAPAVHAQGFPSRPVQVVVGWPPGGGVDTMGRALAAAMSAELGVPVVVDNRPGAAGVIATMAAARAPADGYTLLFMSLSELAVRQAASRTEYDLDRDFLPISLTGVTPIVIAVNSSVPARTPTEFVAWVREQGGHANYGSPGIGTLQHFAGEALRYGTDLRIEHIPYRGAAPAVTDLIGGSIQIVSSGLPPLVGHVAGKRAHLIAASTARRTSVLPDLPTFSEAGWGEVDIANYAGLAAPKGIPSHVLARLEAAAMAAAKHPRVAQVFASAGSEVIGSTSADYARFIEVERARQVELIRATKFVIEE